LVVFGTRPEAIKMAPLVLELKKYSKFCKTIVCVTGQHRKMLDQVLNLFNIVPDFDLDIMKDGQDLNDITTEVLQKLKHIISDIKPEIVLVHGDTSTSTAAALAAFYQKIPIAHIEAGLRTYNRYSPWPEEMNRQITARLSNFHFVPTDINRKNLVNEGINQELIFQTGNTVIDALLFVINKINRSKNFKNEIIRNLKTHGISENMCNSWSNKSRKLILITCHRRENIEHGFVNLCESIRELAKKHEFVDFVYPMHLNPKIRSGIKNVFGFSDFNELHYKNIYFIEPLDYFSFVYMMNLSYIILTDSGGIQEEAPSIGKPLLVLREFTERNEILGIRGSILVGTNKDLIINEFDKLINNQIFYNENSICSNYFGEGNSSKKIVSHLFKILSL